MKKTYTFLLTLAVAATIFSCKKTYTCQCTHNGNGGVGTTYDITGYKRQAKEACSETDKNFADTTCNLK